MRTIIFAYIWICLVSLLLSGWATDFRFNEFDIQLHDAYTTTNALQLSIGFFLIISLISFLFLTIKVRFRNVHLVIVLMIHNLLAILGCIYLLYLSLSISVFQSLFELIQISGPESPSNNSFIVLIKVLATITIPLIVGEVFLIIWALKLKRRIKFS